MQHNKIVTDLSAKILDRLEAFNLSLSNQVSTQIHPSMVVNHKVAYNGAMMKLHHLANVSLRDPTTLEIQVWDKHALKSIEKSLQINNQLGLTIVPESPTTVLAKMPVLTKDKRDSLIKLAKALGEEAKVGVRNLRRDVLKAIAAQEDLNRGDKDNLKKKVDKVITDACDKINNAVSKQQTKVSHI